MYCGGYPDAAGPLRGAPIGNAPGGGVENCGVPLREL